MDLGAAVECIARTFGRLNNVRVSYRVRQFWHSLFISPTIEEMAQARGILPPPLMALFLRLQPGEQAHSLRILRQLLERGERYNDLLVAALLHDIGKSRHPLRLWERVVIVAGRTLFPQQVKRWGQGKAQGWKRPFVVAEQHPAWGAQMSAQAGANPTTVALIRRHQDPLPSKQLTLEDQLLTKLMLLDDES
jgi:hypothetical protein